MDAIKLHKRLPRNSTLDVETLIRFERTLPGNGQLRKMNSHLIAWFKTNGRRFRWRCSNLETYELLITEALLQRTRAETVDAFLPTFLERYPSWSSLAATSRTELEEMLRPIGLYKRRAESLSQLAHSIIKLGNRVPDDLASLAQLPGIGQYLLYAVTMYRQNEPLPLLDGSMARLLERVFGQPRILADLRYDPYLQQLSRKVVAAGDPRQTNWAILDVAAKYCVSREPKCEECPLRSMCSYGSEQRHVQQQAGRTRPRMRSR